MFKNNVVAIFLFLPFATMCSEYQARGTYAIPGSSLQYLTEVEVTYLQMLGMHANRNAVPKAIQRTVALRRSVWAAGLTVAISSLVLCLPQLKCLQNVKGIAGLGIIAALVGRGVYCRTLNTDEIFKNILLIRGNTIEAVRNCMAGLPTPHSLGALSLPAAECCRIRQETNNRDLWPLGALLTEKTESIKKSGNVENYQALCKKLTIPGHFGTVVTYNKFGIIARYNPDVITHEFLDVLTEVEGRKQSRWQQVASWIKGFFVR